MNLNRPAHSSRWIGLPAILAVLVMALLLAALLLLQPETPDVDDNVFTPVPSFATLTLAAPTPFLKSGDLMPGATIVPTGLTSIDGVQLACIPAGQYHPGQ